MDRRFWGVTFVILSLLVAAWIYMDLQTEQLQRDYEHTRSVVDIVDSIAYQGQPDSSLRREKRSGRTLSQQLRGGINELHRRPTDSLQRIIAEDDLLGQGTSPK